MEKKSSIFEIKKYLNKKGFIVKKKRKLEQKKMKQIIFQELFYQA